MGFSFKIPFVKYMEKSINLSALNCSVFVEKLLQTLPVLNHLFKKVYFTFLGKNNINTVLENWMKQICNKSNTGDTVVFKTQILFYFKYIGSTGDMISFQSAL